MSLPQTSSVGLASVSESEHDCRMTAIALLFVRLLCDCFKSRRRLEGDILVLRHQLRRRVEVFQNRHKTRTHLSPTRIVHSLAAYRPFPLVQLRRFDAAAI